jgi:hypothetical protein
VFYRNERFTSSEGHCGSLKVADLWKLRAKGQKCCSKANSLRPILARILSKSIVLYPVSAAEKKGILHAGWRLYLTVNLSKM